MSAHKNNAKSARSPALDYQAKQIIYNVYNYYKKRKLDKTTYEHKADVNMLELVSAMTGTKSCTVKKVIKEGNIMTYEEGFAIFKPKENNTKPRKKRIVVNDMTQGIIRRKILQNPFLKTVHKLVKKENILQCSKEFLRRLIFRLGFSARHYPGLPSVLVESADVLAERMDYLETVNIHLNQNRSMLYLINTKNWANDKNNIKDMPSFVMVHRSGPGFINKVQCMVKLKPNSADDECFEHFENYDWMKDVVLPNIPAASIVIVDIAQNATLEAIFAKKPTEDAPVSELKLWLNNYNIPFEDNASTSELMEIIKSQEAKVGFSITKLITESGHHLLHLPLNHFDLNPVAVVWDNIKDDANKTSATELFTKYSKEQWEYCSLHVKENEAEYYTYGVKVKDPDYFTNLGSISIARRDQHLHLVPRRGRGRPRRDNATPNKNQAFRRNQKDEVTSGSSDSDSEDMDSN